MSEEGRVDLSRERRDAYRRLFATRDGEVVMDDLLKFCHFYNDMNSTDPYTIMYYNGMRRMALRILSFCQPENPIEHFGETLNVRRNTESVE